MTALAGLDPVLRRAVLVVAALNLAYFGVEFLAAISSRSLSLFADSADFLEDAAVNLLIFVALGWTALRRARLGMVLSAILLVPAGAFLWSLAQKYAEPVPPEAVLLSLTGLGALIVNLGCAAILVRHRHSQGSLTRAAFLSARNDAAANIGIIGAGLITYFHPSIWPDVLVGLAIAAMNIDAAGEVWRAARSESAAASAPPHS